MERLNVSLASASLHLLKMYCSLYRSPYSVDFICLSGILVRDLVGFFVCLFKRFFASKSEFLNQKISKTELALTRKQNRKLKKSSKL